MSEDHMTLGKEQARRVENTLYNFRKDKARLESLQGELRDLDKISSLKVQSFDVGRTGAGVSDPVADRVVKIEARAAHLHREIFSLGRKTRPVESLIAYLTQPELTEDSYLAGLYKVLKLRYFEGWRSWGRIAGELNASGTTVKRRNRELLRMAAEWMNGR